MSQTFTLQKIDKLREERRASELIPLRFGQNLAQRFMDGVANACIDVKLKAENETVRIWLRYATERDASEVLTKLAVRISGYEDEAGQIIDGERFVLATAGFEVLQPTHKRVGIWHSLTKDRFALVEPPIWWTTGHPTVDRWIKQTKSVPDIRDYRRDSGHHVLTQRMLGLLHDCAITVRPSGIAFIAPTFLDETVELHNIVVGPFNYR